MKDLLQSVQLYFEGIHECDVSKLKKVFHPESSLFDSDKGSIYVEKIDSFLDDVSTRVSPSSVGQKMKAEILMIDSGNRNLNVLKTLKISVISNCV